MPLNSRAAYAPHQVLPQWVSHFPDSNVLFAFFLPNFAFPQHAHVEPPPHMAFQRVWSLMLQNKYSVAWWSPPSESVQGSEKKGPQRRSQKRLCRWLEEVAKAVGGGYCRLQMPLKPALGVREAVAGHRLGALEGRGGGYSPPSNASLPTPPLPHTQERATGACRGLSVCGPPSGAGRWPGRGRAFALGGSAMWQTRRKAPGVWSRGHTSRRIQRISPGSPATACPPTHLWHGDDLRPRSGQSTRSCCCSIPNA